jgi:hypothetical protein
MAGVEIWRLEKPLARARTSLPEERRCFEPHADSLQIKRPSTQVQYKQTSTGELAIEVKSHSISNPLCLYDTNRWLIAVIVYHVL